MIAQYLPKFGNKTTAMSKQIVFIIAAFLASLILVWQLFGPSLYRTRTATQTYAPSHIKPRYWSARSLGGLEGIANWKKPKNLKKIVGIVFYGRPATVSILDCYLKRNLVKNGGMLDEVVWIVRTNSTEDKAWLDVMLQTEELYSKWQAPNFTNAWDYRHSYDMIENGTMYIKIDDDIVFMEDTVIPSIAHAKWNEPEYYIISANVMNQPALSWVHYHLGAVHPYLPELDPPPPSKDYPEDLRVDWKSSALPEWKGPADFQMELDYKNPHKKHRWLPVKYESSNLTLDETPIQHTGYGPFSEALFKWTIAAQEHYSFFQNLEKNELWRYKFHSWDYNYTRMGIQFVAMMGDDINMGKPMEENDDEYFFSQVMTQRTRRHGIVDGRGVVSHYSFGPQRDGIATTDVLDRYRTFAREHICYY